MNKTLVVLAGPTAVGKTSTAIKVAQALHAEIYSADSRQVYKELTIGTAKPSEEELSTVPHHFVNHISIHDDYTAGTYEREVIAHLDRYFETHDVAVLTGGTGLYLKAIMEGLDDFPDVPPAITQQLEDLYAAEGVDALHRLLEKTDREYFDEVDLSNHRRLIRALGVIETTGRPYSEYRLGNKVERPFRIVPVLLTRDRIDLYERINDRVELMWRHGLRQEAQELYDHQMLRSMQTVGYSEVFLLMEGLIDDYTAIELIKRNTRRYAKRQLTWFRRDDYWQEVHADDTDATQQILQIVESAISGSTQE